MKLVLDGKEYQTYNDRCILLVALNRYRSLDEVLRHANKLVWFYAAKCKKAVLPS